MEVKLRISSYLGTVPFVCLLLWNFSSILVINCQSVDDKNVKNDEAPAVELDFIQKLLDKYGENNTLNVTQLASLIEAIENMNTLVRTNLRSQYETSLSKTKEIEPLIFDNGYGDKYKTAPAGKQSCGNSSTCLDDKCLSAEDIFELHNVSVQSEVDASQLGSMSPAILYKLQQPACLTDQNNHVPTHRHRHKPQTAEVWGFAFVCVTLINLCALLGMIFIPLMKKALYKHVLLYMVALAVGTLSGSSLLFLIPEAFELTSEESPLGVTYMWRATVVMAGVYMFFMTERILKMITDYKQKKQEGFTKNEDQLISSIKSHHRHRDDSLSITFQATEPGIPHNTSEAVLIDNAVIEDEASLQTSNGGGGGVSPRNGEKKEIKAVAWMVIFGDGIHNFIDGLSIGAAFTQSTMTGISVSLAVICEELPHELGDFAILLNSGMRMRQALMYNFLSACMCYIGMFLGILVGEMTAGSRWIFALAGGMFLYISLVDMFPEVHAAVEEEEKKTGRTWYLFFLQNAGLLSGFGIMLLLRYYGDMISLDL